MQGDGVVKYVRSENGQKFIGKSTRLSRARYQTRIQRTWNSTTKRRSRKSILLQRQCTRAYLSNRVERRRDIVKEVPLAAAPKICRLTDESSAVGIGTLGYQLVSIFLNGAPQIGVWRLPLVNHPFTMQKGPTLRNRIL